MMRIPNPATGTGTGTSAQQDRLLNIRLAEEIDQETFATKHTQLRDRLVSIKLQLDVLDRSHDETAELAAKAFELSQTLQEQWVDADYATKRRLLEIVCLNCRLEGNNIVPTMRKPFDVLVEGLDLSKSRGDRTPVELFAAQIVLWSPQTRLLLSTRNNS